ncbi:hybrid sensor histidine kinase/response regulator [Salinigranum halophilum]|uniref:hybrid sensor histidine kinase/response regulator n=1 Tax=Salinigranum halophilum TaxID=2565931 RepID=UPI0010A89F72|nr:PAS domain-containing sensor histidine kinase [Salinigranum halophilum]
MTEGVTAVVLGDEDSEAAAAVARALDDGTVRTTDSVDEASALSREVDCVVVTSVGRARALLERLDGEPACPVVVLTARATPVTDRARVRHHPADALGTLGERLVDAVLADRERQRAANRADDGDRGLAEREAAYRTLVEHIPNGGVALFDRDLRYTWVGGEVFERVDLDHEDIAGKTLEEVHSPAFLDANADAYRRAFEGERASLAFVYDDRHFRLDIVPVPDGDEVVAGLAMTRDVTDEVAGQRDLLVRTRAMDAAAIGLCLTDPNRPDNPLIYVNEGYERMTGYDAEEVLGRNPRHLKGPETEAEASRQMREAVENAESVSVDVTNYRKDGTPFVNHVDIVPLFDDEGDLVHFLGSQVDVTDQYERERALARQNEQLAEFASIVSHDLQSPLAVARGRIELARATGDLSHLEQAETGLERASELIDDLLTLAREGQTLDPARVETVAVDAVARAAWDTVDTSGATLTVVDEWTVDADESRLRQLFENLFRNGVEHGATGGRSVEVRVGPLSERCGFVVEDDGPGVPEEVSERLFEAGVTTAEDGTGFGLAIVRSIAEAHGWAVRQTDSERGGARFEFDVPCLGSDDD